MNIKKWIISNRILLKIFIILMELKFLVCLCNPILIVQQHQVNIRESNQLQKQLVYCTILTPHHRFIFHNTFQQ